MDKVNEKAQKQQILVSFYKPANIFLSNHPNRWPVLFPLFQYSFFLFTFFSVSIGKTRFSPRQAHETTLKAHEKSTGPHTGSGTFRKKGRIDRTTIRKGKVFFWNYCFGFLRFF